MICMDCGVQGRTKTCKRKCMELGPGVLREVAIQGLWTTNLGVRRMFWYHRYLGVGALSWPIAEPHRCTPGRMCARWAPGHRCMQSTIP